MSRLLIRGGLASLLLLVGGWHAAGIRSRADAPESGASWREGFESPRPSWRQEETDLTVRLRAHERTGDARHEGRQSERFVFSAEGPGSALFYSLPLPKIPLVPDLEASLYVRATHPGIQLSGRIVLPADTDPDTGQPSFLLVPGTASDDADRWERLELTDLVHAAEAQARILRIRTNRKISLEGAYLERLVVNLYGGPGESEVFLDDLTITPVPESLASNSAAAREPRPPETARPEPPRAGDDGTRKGEPSGVDVDSGRLTREGRDWLPTILAAPGADLAVALPFGFDVVEVEPGTDPDKLRAVASMGAVLMPNLARAATAQEALDQVAAFPVPEAVAFWNLGESLGNAGDAAVRKDELERARAVILGLRERPDGTPRLTTGVVLGDYTRYVSPGRELDLMGIDAQAWGSSRQPADAYQYLLQRRQLTALWNVSLPHWAWVDAASRPVVRSGVWGDDVPPPWGVPRVQPEQVRLGTYMALMAGYRGIGYRADADLTRPGGRAVLYELGLLNAEMDLVESILARGKDPIVALPTFLPDPKRIITFNVGGTQSQLMGRGVASENRPFPEAPSHGSIRCASISTQDGRGRLLVVADLSAGAQWQPPQMAINDLKMRVPGAPDSAQALELSLGGSRWLERERVPGGVQFTIPEFGVSTLILLTTDFAMAERLTRAIESIRPQAVDLAIRQARLQIDWVAETNARLVTDGHTVSEATELLRLADESLRSAEERRAAEDFQVAWEEARRATRPLRLLMRMQWEQAVEALAVASGRPRENPNRRPGSPRPPRILAPPVASAPLLSFNTLPQHHVWCDWIRYGRFGPTLLPTGAFATATPESLNEAGWTDVGQHDDKAVATLRLEPEKGKPAGSPNVLKLTVAPPDPKAIDRLATFFDHPPAAIRTPPVPVKAREFVRIRVKIRMPRRLPPGTGGLIVRDSLGSELLQFRTTEPIPDWTDLVLYRRVPADGELTVMIGLAGYGVAYLDDLRIDRLEQVRSLPGSGGDLADDASGDAPELPAASLPASLPAAPGRPGRRATATRADSARRSVR
jgi:hypothetical protein